MSDAASPHGYRVYYQDLRKWKAFSGGVKPGTLFKSFATRAEAVAFRATLPTDPDYIVTMTAAPPPRARKTVDPSRAPSAEWLGGRMRSSGRKLTE